ncbi:hypothetical protein GCM10017567_11860 [Amycolatopsis bullii]|uniref:Uncharacterized protein n=1 Tax=Amycolatopsis bullii TaxID=941987 RepID=A0ABQ3K7E7_9PSEU|nr:hypothetical protein GCM10017567_11860 [Amycolatopsis bullii]
MNRVDGFMLKDAPSDKLTNAIRNVAAGQRVLDNQLALTAWDTTDCPLINREMDIFRLAAGGHNAVDIAAEARSAWRQRDRGAQPVTARRL